MLNGYKKIFFNDNELSEFYQNPTKYCAEKLVLYNNQYLMVGYNDKITDYYIFKNGTLHKITYPVFDNPMSGKTTPRNDEQYLAMNLMLDVTIPVKALTGRFGSGKSFLMINGAIQALNKNKIEKIIYIRNNIQVKDTDSLGALPGSLLSKTIDYAMPFADHCGGVEGIYSMIERGQLEIIPLAFLRGRSLRNSIIYSTESENLTKQHIQLLLGRVDEGSQLWIEGDIKQRDRKVFEQSKGLETLIDRLSGNELFGYVHLEKTERGKVAALADLLD